MEETYSVILTKKKYEKTKREGFPKYFLGDSVKEAEELFNTFKDYLNKLSNTYSFSTGIDREEFFSEGVIALGKAKKDYKEYKSSDFVSYAKFLIMDAMNECIRNNRATVKIPSYINKTNKIINRIKKLLKTEDNWFNIVFECDLGGINLPDSVKEEIRGERKLVERAAKRANLEPKKLVERSEFLPNVISSEYLYNDDNIYSSDEQHENLLTKLLIDKLMIVLSEDERTISKLLMNGLNKSEIASMLDKSDTWVNNRIKDIKNKLLEMSK